MVNVGSLFDGVDQRAQHQRVASVGVLLRLGDVLEGFGLLGAQVGVEQRVGLLLLALRGVGGCLLALGHLLVAGQQAVEWQVTDLQALHQ
ncbi:hypothetical protein D3C81_2185000 [compost metagenome]